MKMMGKFYQRIKSVLDLLDCRVCPSGHENAYTLRHALSVAYHAAGGSDSILSGVQRRTCDCSFAFIIHLKKAIEMVPLEDRLKVRWFFRE